MQRGTSASFDKSNKQAKAVKMGQKEKAAAIIAEQYNFRRVTSVSPDDVFTVADRVASQVKMRMGSLTRLPETRVKNETKMGFYNLKGPGGMVSIATISLMTFPHKGETGISLVVEEYLYQKGSLGTKPTINGSKNLQTFISTLRAELEAMGART